MRLSLGNKETDVISSIDIGRRNAGGAPTLYQAAAIKDGGPAAGTYDADQNTAPWKPLPDPPLMKTKKRNIIKAWQELAEQERD